MSKKPREKSSQPIVEAQEDFWDLGDENLEPEVVETGENKENLADLSDFSEEIQPESASDDSLREDKQKSESDSPAPDADSPSSEIKSVRKKQSTSISKKKDQPPTSLLEKISLLLVVACLLGILGWGISAFINEAPQGDIISFKEDYPAKGDFVTISTVKTGWRKPIRKGENADLGIVLEAELIPCAKITLNEGASTTLRVTFRNGDGELIGDTLNLSIEDGKFTRSGSSSIDVCATDGFESASEINAYTNGDIAPWAVIITEGATGNEDQPLVKARISADSNQP